MAEFERILLAGAAGSLGGHLRTGLAPSPRGCASSTSARSPGPSRTRSVVVCNLADKAAAFAAIEGCDAIVHFAGHPREQSFEEIVADTLPAAYHVWEGARRFGVKRVVYASSIHAVGFAPVETVPDTGRCTARHLLRADQDLHREYRQPRSWDDVRRRDRGLAHLFVASPSPGTAGRCGRGSPSPTASGRAGGADRARVGFSVIVRGLRQRRARGSNLHAGHIGFRAVDSADAHAAAVRAGVPRPANLPRRPRRRRQLRRRSHPDDAG